ncbi:MAG: 50S ribosomal protein L21 [Thermodesulfobacteriota bacterium]|jgi:large subunit ribosomal protein L21|nr:50S ribosomal protein L21 [Desulfovibrionales bacterium]MDD5450295.1 50S ribosomal protein L21 [Desulfovibrionales bacterium]MDQ7837035.1 50S ribosomal protein L21 [Thermodesulfobacteriota bacterium]
MYAVIKTGGKQYKVSSGDTVRVEKLAGNVGDAVTLSDVLLVAKEGDIKIGQPTVAGAQVTGKIVDQARADKIMVFKKKRRKGYSKKQGHRQPYTALKIEDIQF